MRKLLATISIIALCAAQAQAQQINGGGGAGGAGSGTVTSVATTCGVSGGPITTSGTVQGSASDNAQSGATYTVLSTDCGKVDRFTGSSPVITVPSLPASGFAAGNYFTLKCEASAGSCSTSGTIDGSASAITIAVGNSIDLYIDASNGWHKLPGNGGATFANPSATAGPNANNGSATTAMRSDASPAVQLGSASQAGLIQCGTGTSCSGGVLNASGGSPGGSSGQIQTNNGSGGFGALATNANANHPGYSATIDGSTAWWLPIEQSYQQTASGAFNATSAYCTIGEIGGTSLVTIQGLGVVGTTVGTSNIQLAIYNNDTSPSSAPSTGISYTPGALIDSTPNIVNTATGSNSANLNATHQISPGFYWFCLQSNDTTYRAKSLTINAISAGAAWIGATSPNAAVNSVLQGYVTTTGITSFGTWPSTFHGASFSSLGANAPLVSFSLASVP